VTHGGQTIIDARDPLTKQRRPFTSDPRRRVRFLVASLTLACVLTACGLGIGPAFGAIPRAFYGTVPNTGLDPGDFDRMAAARVGSLRIGINWPDVQASRNGPFNFGGVDQLIGQAASHHIRVLATLFQTPPFETNGCTSVFCLRHISIGTQAKRNDWKAFVKAAVSRYGRHGDFWTARPDLPYEPVTRWQIWNEQNNPNQKNRPKLYAKLLKITHRAFKSSRDPKAKIVTGGMFGTPPNGPTAWGYVRGLYKHRIGKRLDGVSIHPYAPNLAGLRRQVKNVRKVLKRHHHASVRTLITEIGWGSSRKRYPGTGSRGAAFNVGPKKQKRNLNRSFKLLTSHRKRWKLGGIFWFSWKDPLNPPAGLCAFCYSSGLYHADGTTPKQALEAYEKFTRRTKHH
jgi:hypothetical protein